MKTAYIVGVGMNSPTLLADGIVHNCDVLLGAPKQLAIYSVLGKPSFGEYKPDKVRAIIEQRPEQRFAVLVSGDVGFYSGAIQLVEALEDYEVRLIAGVPSFCEFFAKLKLPWQDAALVSMHGANSPLISTVRRNKLTFCLTGSNTSEIGAKLVSAGFADLTVHVGENLGYPNERVFSLKASKLGETPPMTVLLIVNDSPDCSVRFGIPDFEFERLESVPMTKSEVRAMIMSKLCLAPNFVCYDVGAGTGSVTVEMAVAAFSGQVFAVERNKDALPLIERNLKRFHIGNVTTIPGRAPEVLASLPVPDAVFIGGSGGELPEIIRSVLTKNAGARIVVTAIALETAYSALTALENSGVCGVELVQLNVSRANSRAGLHMMIAQNPIFIIYGGGTR